MSNRSHTKSDCRFEKKSTQDEKVRFIIGNELKLPQVELVSFCAFKREEEQAKIIRRTSLYGRNLFKCYLMSLFCTGWDETNIFHLRIQMHLHIFLIVCVAKFVNTVTQKVLDKL